MAWQAEAAKQRLRPIDGLNLEQRFFIGYVQWACENSRLETCAPMRGPPRIRRADTA